MRRSEQRLSSDPWKDAPTEELQDQVLPRWFVLLGITTVLIALVTVVAAFTVFGRSDVPVAQRRPPPPAQPAGRTHDVGEVQIGTAEPEVYDGACALLDGVRVAGTDRDTESLRRGLAGVCNLATETDVTDVTGGLRSFAASGGVVRFATFEATGVDSTVDLGVPQILINARFSRSDPLQIAPLIAHDVIAMTAPGDAGTELSARISEADVCARLFTDLPRSCTDAANLVALPDPMTALLGAGYE